MQPSSAHLNGPYAPVTFESTSQQRDYHKRDIPTVTTAGARRLPAHPQIEPLPLARNWRHPITIGPHEFRSAIGRATSGRQRAAANNQALTDMRASLASGDQTISQPGAETHVPQSSAAPVETVSNPEPATQASSPPSLSYAALLRYASRRERQATALGCLSAVVTGGGRGRGGV